MAIPGISKIETLATKYSKPQLAHMAQIGLIAPTEAVMAGMMIDRIMKENMKPPTTTVAQDVLAPGMPPQMGMPEGEAPQAPEDMANTGGLAALPAGDTGNYAGGGIVAFADGGTPYKIHEAKLDTMAVPAELTPEQAMEKSAQLKKAFGINQDFYKERGAEVAGEREK